MTAIIKSPLTRIVQFTRAAGGSMEDQLQAMGAINPGGRVVGGRGRIFSDDEIGQAIGSRETKKWWQFWK